MNVIPPPPPRGFLALFCSRCSIISFKSCWSWTNLTNDSTCTLSCMRSGDHPEDERYCNHRNFRTRFNFVLFVLSAESTKFSSIRKPCTYNSVCDTVLAVRKCIANESSQTLEYEIFTRTKISAITVVEKKTPCTVEFRRVMNCHKQECFSWKERRSQVYKGLPQISIHFYHKLS